MKFINNVNTGLIYSVSDIPFEAGIDHVFVLERSNTNPNSLTGMDNSTKQSCEEMIGHFLFIKKK